MEEATRLPLPERDHTLQVYRPSSLLVSQLSVTLAAPTLSLASLEAATCFTLHDWLAELMPREGVNKPNWAPQDRGISWLNPINQLVTGS